MCNCTEANLFNVGNSIVCLFYKGEKNGVIQRTSGEESSSPHE